MSGLDWKKQGDRSRIAARGAVSKSDDGAGDRLSRQANAFLAAHPYPSKLEGNAKVAKRQLSAKIGQLNRTKSSYTSLDKAVPSGVVIYADGCCEPNPGPGGWGFAVYRNGVEVYADCGGDLATTNNVQEMTGALMALRWLADRSFEEVYGAQPASFIPTPPRLLCDSQYVVNGCTIWRHGWKRKGWRRGVEKPLANVELWQALDEVLGRVPVKIEWVKGHAGIVGNERADELSLMGRERAIEYARVADPIRRQLTYSL